MARIGVEYPLTPASFGPEIAKAFQLLSTGECPAHLQIAALDWLLKSACKTNVLPYRDTDRATYVAIGQQFVGHQVAALLSVNTAKLTAPNEPTEQP